MANVRFPTIDVPEVSNNMHGKIERASTIKSIYVQDAELWGLAKLLAAERGMSMSELVMAGISKLVHDACPVCERIAEVLSTGTGKPVKVKKSAK